MKNSKKVSLWGFGATMFAFIIYFITYSWVHSLATDQLARLASIAFLVFGIFFYLSAIVDESYDSSGVGLMWLLGSLCLGACVFLEYIETVYYQGVSIKDYAPLLFGTLSSVTFWVGIYLFLENKKKSHRPWSSVLVMSGAIFAVLFLAYYYLPGPVRLNGSDIFKAIALAVVVLFMTFMSYKFVVMKTEEPGMTSPISTAFCVVLNLFLLAMFVVHLNNCIYSGPKILYMTGCACIDDSIKHLTGDTTHAIAHGAQ